MSYGKLQPLGFWDFLIEQYRLMRQVYGRGQNSSRGQFLKLIRVYGDFPRGNISWDEAEAYLRSCDFSEERIRNAKSLYRKWWKECRP